MKGAVTPLKVQNPQSIKKKILFLSIYTAGVVGNIFINSLDAGFDAKFISAHLFIKFFFFFFFPRVDGLQFVLR